MTESAVELGPVRQVPAREVAVGNYVWRRYPSGTGAGWLRVVAVTWRPAKRRYYVRLERPEELRNRLSDHFFLRPAASIDVRVPVSRGAGGRDETHRQGR